MSSTETTSTPPEATAGAPSGPAAHDITVDLLVVGSGTGLAAALTAHERGLRPLVIEKTEYVGGSTARSGGAFWIPGNPTLRRDGSPDSVDRAAVYLDAIVDDVPDARWRNFLDNGPAAVEMLGRTTPLQFFWTEGYSDYHPEQPGGSAIGRTCESLPFDAKTLGDERGRLRGAVLEAPVPMPVTGADYRWMNLMTRRPGKAVGRIAKRFAQGLGGMALGREYVAGGQALAAGLFAGAIDNDIPIWTRTELLELLEEDGRVVGAVARQDDRTVTIRAARGVVLAAGGFDHNMAMRHEHQSASLIDHISLGAEGNTGDSIRIAEQFGAQTALMQESWWFPAIAPVEGTQPSIILAERSMPGSLIVDQRGRRFVNESTDYMSFGQRVLELERTDEPVTDMWMVFDQTYKNRYVLTGAVFPRAPLPDAWYEAGIAHQADDVDGLADALGIDPAALAATLTRFNELAGNGIDDDFGRGASRYDQYYGDPKNVPNPNLRPLEGHLYAVKVVLSDLGTCGGIVADDKARVLRADGSPTPGLYAIGNNAANAFGHRYPGAGATIGQGLVFGYIAAVDAAS